MSTADVTSLSIPEMEAALARFEARTNTAMSAGPPSKEWVCRSLRREGTGRCPVWIKRVSPDIVLRYGDALADLFCQYPDDAVRVVPYDLWIGYQSPSRARRVNPVEVAMRDAQWEDEWGTRWGHARGGVGATPIAYPLEDWAGLDTYLRQRMPDPRAPGRFDAAARLLAAHGRDRYCFGAVHLALFERLHALRGMENVFSDFYTHERDVCRLLEAIAGYTLELVRGWARLGADGVFFTDDWGSQTALMISPAMWRRLFRPYYAAWFAETHRLGMEVFFHSCGNVTAIVGDLIEIGMDVLDPVQPGAMDVQQIARRYGGQVAFCGAIDLQQLLALGTPQEVRDTVRRTIGLLGDSFGGSYLISPANVLTPDIPLENLAALLQAAHEQS